MNFNLRKAAMLSLTLVSLLFFSCQKTQVNITDCDFNSLSNGEEIPWEWVIEFDDTTSNRSKKSILSEFRDSVEIKALEKYNSINVGKNTSISKRDNVVDSCLCDTVKYLISIGIQVEEVVVGTGASSTSDLAINDRNCDDTIPSNWRDNLPYQPTLAELTAMFTRPGIKSITKNKFLMPKKSVQGSEREDCGGWQSILPGIGESGEGTFVIAIIDSGLDVCYGGTIQNRLWKNPLEKTHCSPGKNVGWNFVENSADISDKILHGTKVTWILDESLNVTKCKPRYMILKIFTKCYGSTFHAACAIDYARQNGADIMNCSWGMYGEDQNLITAVQKSNSSKIPMVCSIGNDCRMLGVSNFNPHIPSDYFMENMNYVVSTSGIKDNSPWGWQAVTGPSGTGTSGYVNIDLWVPSTASSSGYAGTNICVNTPILAEPAVIDFNIPGVFFGTGEGTSYSAPQLTAKLSDLMCCMDEKFIGNGVIKDLISEYSHEIFQGDVIAGGAEAGLVVPGGGKTNSTFRKGGIQLYELKVPFDANCDKLPEL